MGRTPKEISEQRRQRMLAGEAGFRLVQWTDPIKGMPVALFGCLNLGEEGYLGDAIRRISKLPHVIVATDLIKGCIEFPQGAQVEEWGDTQCIDHIAELREQLEALNAGIAELRGSEQQLIAQQRARHLGAQMLSLYRALVGSPDVLCEQRSLVAGQLSRREEALRQLRQDIGHEQRNYDESLAGLIIDAYTSNNQGSTAIIVIAA